MTTEQPEVECVQDNGQRHQWATGIFYRRDGRKRTLATRKVAVPVGLLLFGLVAYLLLDSDDPAGIEKRKAKSTISAPGDLTPKGGIIFPPEMVRASSPIGDDTAHAESGASHRRGTGKATGKAGPTFLGPQLVARPHASQIPPGTLAKAVLLTGASEGGVRAQLVEPVAVGGETVLKSGMILLGSAHSGENRLNIHFTQLVSQDGAFETVDADACDGSDQIVGIKGSQVGTQGTKLAAGIALNFLGGMSDALQDSEGQSGVLVRAPSVRNAALNGAATASLDQSREIMSDIKNHPPQIEVPAGTKICVLFERGSS